MNMWLSPHMHRWLILELRTWSLPYPLPSSYTLGVADFAFVISSVNLLAASYASVPVSECAHCCIARALRLFAGDI